MSLGASGVSGVSCAMSLVDYVECALLCELFMCTIYVYIKTCIICGNTMCRLCVLSRNECVSTVADGEVFYPLTLSSDH